ncbi:transcriptional antiterminator, BglG family [Pilibacter termitis]|uniref:Transcriptional antiterminator, BglG family n=1 Tax=Pilibacter termitis TaxID=263852 RepID=A0A1T4NM96_9ENTE|nr:PRD domain-containing protein [Pilibacter termitis]SJZ80431.1 transcriptional antiterminator, BglG family [Pilibacter termitis]
MRIKKILNQNAVLVLDGTLEKVAVGKGVGFDKKRNDILPRASIERLFVMEQESVNKLQTLLSQIEERYFFASETIIAHAEQVLNEKLNPHINISLSDHIAFAAENIQNGILVKNKLLKEIESMYAEEYSLALWAIEYLSNTLGIPFPYDEAGYIAIHLHSARTGKQNNSESIREVSIISAIIHLIETELSIDIHSKEMALNYSRLVNHLRLFIHRFMQNNYAVMDTDVLDLVRKKYPKSYDVAKKIQVLLMKDFHYQVPNEELGFLAMHIERMRMEKKS